MQAKSITGLIPTANHCGVVVRTSMLPVKELVSLSTAGDQAAHPEHPVFEALIRRDEDQLFLLQE